MKLKTLKLPLLIMIVLTVCTYANSQTDPEEWSDEQVDIWFKKQDWLGGCQLKPDASINKRSLAIHYYKNPKYWDQAFQFLKSSNLKEMPLEKHALDGTNLFAIVMEYVSKDKTETRYESHKKYADIQYVIEGEEFIGLTTLDKVYKITKPYAKESDIAFYECDSGEDLKATPNNFMIFFPEDLHRPGIKVSNNSKVRKVVVKVLIE